MRSQSTLNSEFQLSQGYIVTFSLKKTKKETRLTKKNRTLILKGLGEYIVCLYGKHSDSEKTGYTPHLKTSTCSGQCNVLNHVTGVVPWVWTSESACQWLCKEFFFLLSHALLSLCQQCFWMHSPVLATLTKSQVRSWLEWEGSVKAFKLCRSKRNKTKTKK